MEKRQALMGGIAAVVLVAAGGFWWFTQQSGAPAEDTTMTVKPQPVVPAHPPAPVVAAPGGPAKSATGAPESDAVALSEEDVDRIKAESSDLAARAADLEEQVKDGQMILDAQEKKIARLEQELKAAGAPIAAAPSAKSAPPAATKAH